MIRQFYRYAAVFGLLGGLIVASEVASAGVGYYYEAPSYYVAPPVYTYSPPAYSTFGFSTYPRYGYAGGYVGSRFYGSYSRYGDLYGNYPFGAGAYSGYPYRGYGGSLRPYADPYRGRFGGTFR